MCDCESAESLSAVRLMHERELFGGRVGAGSLGGEPVMRAERVRSSSYVDAGSSHTSASVSRSLGYDALRMRDARGVGRVSRLSLVCQASRGHD